MTTYTDIVFPDPLRLEWLGGTRKDDGSFYRWDQYVLLHEWRCIYMTDDGVGGVVTAESSFINDRASIPPWGQSFVQKDGPWQAGATTHDRTFWHQGKDTPGIETFEDANALFYASLLGHRRGTDPHVFRTAVIERNIIMAAVESPAGQAAWDDDS